MFRKIRENWERRSLRKRARECRRCAGEGRHYVWDRQNDRTRLAACYDCKGTGIVFEPTLAEIVHYVLPALTYMPGILAAFCGQSRIDRAIELRMKG